VRIFLEGEDSRDDHGLGRLVEFTFKAPPGTTSSSIATHTPSGQRNCASWASQPQKSVTLLPCPGGRTTKSTKDMWWHWTKKTCFGLHEPSSGSYFAKVKTLIPIYKSLLKYSILLLHISFSPVVRVYYALCRMKLFLYSA